MNPNHPSVLHNNDVTTENFRIGREVQEFRNGPSKGVKFVNSGLAVIDTRSDEKWVRGELTFLNAIPVGADLAEYMEEDELALVKSGEAQPVMSHWDFCPSRPKHDLENLGPHCWNQEDLLELAQLMGKLQPEQSI